MASVGAAFVTIGLGLASMAWACTVQPRVFSVAPSSALPGGTATVNGEGVQAGAPVEVRWNALDGAAIGKATADREGRFAVPVTVPNAPAGVHSIVLVAGNAEGPFALSTTGLGVGRISFQVTSAGAAGAASSPPSGAWTSPSTGYTPPDRTGGGLPLGVGVGLAGLGLVTVFAGSTVVALRRRRLPTKTSRR